MSEPQNGSARGSCSGWRRRSSIAGVAGSSHSLCTQYYSGDGKFNQSRRNGFAPRSGTDATRDGRAGPPCPESLCHARTLLDVQRRPILRGNQANRYAALAEDANAEESIVRGLTLPKINQQLVRGPFILVPGVRRKEGEALLREMNKASGAPADLKT